MKYTDIDVNMIKEAGWERYFPRLATRIALNKSWGYPIRQALPWFIGGALKDLPGAAGKAAINGGAKGLGFLWRFYTGDKALSALSRLSRIGQRAFWTDVGVSAIAPEWREKQLNWLGRLWDKGKDKAAEGSVTL